MLHLYAILDRPPRRLPGRPKSGSPLRVIRCGSVVAVAGERTRPPQVTLSALRGHDRVVRALSANGAAVAPVRFGTVVADEQRLRRLVAGRAGRLGTLLRRIRGCEQMTLRVVDSVASRRDRRKRSTMAEAARAGPGTRFMRARQASRAARSAALAEVRATFAPIVIGERVEPASVAPVVATVHHLVPRRRLRAYLAAAARLAAGGEPGVRVSGPTPCYAFADHVRL